MDPKMDSGYLGPGETLEDDYDVLHEILPEEVVGIMDQLLCSEVRCHLGYQSVGDVDMNLDLGSMVYGQSSTPDPLLVVVHRQVALAGAEDTRTSLLQA